MKRLNKKTYKAIKQAKAVITITQHGDVVKLNVDFLPPAKTNLPSYSNIWPSKCVIMPWKF